MAGSQTEIKVPSLSPKTTARDVANTMSSSIKDDSGKWFFIEDCAPSTAEQRARLLNAQTSPWEFGYSVRLNGGRMVSTLWGRNKTDNDTDEES